MKRGGARGEGEQRGVSEPAGRCWFGAATGSGPWHPALRGGASKGSSFLLPEERYPDLSPQRRVDTESGATLAGDFPEGCV